MFAPYAADMRILNLLALGLFTSLLCAQPGMELYRQQCSACHGERGRGDGPAARFLDPKPRDFRSGYFRFISASNSVPTDGDLWEAISAGLPGSAMLSFAHLPPEQRTMLVDIVRGFRRDGLRERFATAIQDPAALEAAVLEADTPGPLVDMPAETPNTVDARANGALLFTRLCSACHGADGRGVYDPARLTAEGDVAQPRDLTRGVLKGGVEDVRLWQRIRAGIPGTPMPAVPQRELSDADTWDLVHYVQALIPRGQQELHDPMPWTIAVPRHKGTLPTSADDPAFAALKPTWVALAPFQSHTRTVEGVSVRALHDGEHIALRLEYADRTYDVAGAKAVAPDGVAVRVTSTAVPPVLPIPGSPLPVDRALWLASAKPAADDPVFDKLTPRFENPDGVCRSPIGPEHVGRAQWRDGVWTVLMVLRPERAGHIAETVNMPVSFAIFDGSVARGPLPAAFSHWQRLHFER
ncbi:MAG: c-type cytochrome [Planctomycetes bacterium]|nr:c-type cytochrome [Planctomycetota bacterium]